MARIVLVVFLIYLVNIQHANTFEFEGGQIHPRIKADLNALDNGLKFVERYYKQFGVDGLMGIVLTEATLKKTSNEIATKPLNEILIKLIKRISKLRVKIVEYMKKEDYSKMMYKRYKKILVPELWMKTINNEEEPPKFININRHLNLRIINVVQSSTSAIYKYRTDINGRLIEKTFRSDECILPILNFKDLSMKCARLMLPENCQIYNTNLKQPKPFNTNNYGYALSHRLLIMQVASRLNVTLPLTMKSKCNNAKIVEMYCKAMFEDAATTKSSTSANIDLIFEDFVLCGIEEYYDANFLNMDFLNWQKEEGCFAASMDHNYGYEKRSMNTVGKFNTKTSNVCNDHTTGLGLVAIVMHLKIFLKECLDYL